MVSLTLRWLWPLWKTAEGYKLMVSMMTSSCRGLLVVGYNFPHAFAHWGKDLMPRFSDATLGQLPHKVGMPGSVSLLTLAHAAGCHLTLDLVSHL